MTIPHTSPKTRFFGLHFYRKRYCSKFNHSDVIRPQVPNSVK